MYAVVTPAGGFKIRPSRVDSSLVLSVVTKVVETWGCRGASEVGDDVSGEALHDFGSWRRSAFVRRTRWGRFFWFVRRRGDGRRDLRTDFERWRAGALVLELVVACSGADGIGWQDAGAGAVEGVAVTAAAAAAGVGGGVGVGGAGVDDAGGVDVAAVVVTEVVGIF